MRWVPTRILDFNCSTLSALAFAVSAEFSGVVFCSHSRIMRVPEISSTSSFTRRPVALVFGATRGSIDLTTAFLPSTIRPVPGVISNQGLAISINLREIITESSTFNWPIGLNTRDTETSPIVRPYSSSGVGMPVIPQSTDFLAGGWIAAWPERIAIPRQIMRRIVFILFNLVRGAATALQQRVHAR